MIYKHNMGLLRRIFSYLIDTKWQYRLRHSIVRISAQSSYQISKSVKLNNCQLVTTGKSSIIIEDGVCMKNVVISVDNAYLHIGKNSIIGDDKHQTMIDLNKGCKVSIGEHSKISLKRIWCRFAGKVSIGDYTNVNYHSEIRCDQQVTIGSYCQISYNVNIWDTNTHNILPTNQRKELAEKYFPYFGYEESRPKTNPVVIGNYCWLGERCSILKGSHLGGNVIIGYNTVISGINIEKDKCVVSDLKLRIL